MKFIDLDRQKAVLGPNVELAIKKVLAHGQFIMGPEVYDLEERLADYVGVKHCISVSSGSDALLVSLIALGIKAGDEVITPAFSFAATCEMVLLLNAIPVFVDVDPLTANIDLDQIESAISERTKAIIPVSLYGQCPNLEKISQIADLAGIPVIEDAAQSFGSKYFKRKSCSMTTLAATSFFPSKPLGCYGDGGAIFTDSDDLAEACSEIRVHGQAGRYNHVRVGICGRLDTIQAAILIEKLKILDSELVARRSVAEIYGKLLNGAPITVMKIEEGIESSYAQYTLRSKHREKILRRMNELGIPCAVHYPKPLHKQKAYRQFYEEARPPLISSENLAIEVFSLPMHPYLREDEQEMVVETLRVALEDV